MGASDAASDAIAAARRLKPKFGPDAGQPAARKSPLFGLLPTIFVKERYDEWYAKAEYALPPLDGVEPVIPPINNRS